MDYWLTVADGPRGILKNYTAVTGRAPMFPEDRMGLWQCKLRYRTQERRFLIPLIANHRSHIILRKLLPALKPRELLQKFVFGTPIAYNLHKPFVLVRKKGKLPCETISKEYDLEYGSAVIEMHRDSIQPGQKVVRILLTYSSIFFILLCSFP